MKIILSIILLFVVPNAFSQNCEEVAQNLLEIENNFFKLELEQVKSKTDSIYATLTGTCWQAEKQVNLNLGRYYSKTGNSTLAKTKLRLALKVAQAHKEYFIQRHIYDLLSNIEGELENFDLSFALADTALAIPSSGSPKEIKQELRVRLNTAVLLADLGRNEEAIEIYNEAEQVLIKGNLTKDSIYHVAINNALGNIYTYNLQDHHEAIHKYQQAVRYCPYNHRSIYSMYNNIGNTFLELNQLDSAEFYYNNTLNTSQNVRDLITPWQGKAEIELKRNSYNEAISHFRKALVYAEESEMELYVRDTKAMLSKALYINGNHREADKLLKKLSGLNKTGPPKELYDLEIDKYYYLNRVALTNSKLSSDFHTFFEAYDSLNSEAKESRLNNSITRYEKRILSDSLERVKLIKDTQSLTIKSNRLSIISLILLLTTSFFSILYIIRRLKSAKSKNTELIFKNEELELLNSNLQKRIENENKIEDTIKENTIPKVINIKVLNKIHPIQVESIRYIKAEDEGVRIFTDTSSIWTDMTLKNIHKQISKEHFIKIYRSTIVNASHIEWVNSTTLRLKDGTDLKIGRTYKDQIKKVINLK